MARRGSHCISVFDLFFFMTQCFPTFMNFLGFPLPLHLLLGLSGMSSGPTDVAAVVSFLAAAAGRSKPRSCSLASSRSCGFFLGLFLRL